MSTLTSTRLKRQSWTALARAHAALGSLPPPLRAAALDVRAGAGETLFRTGSRPRLMLFVVDGEVRLVRHTAGGADVILQRARSGFVAEASLDSARYHCDVEAAADSRLIGFPVEQFRESLARDPAFREFWMRRLAMEVRKLRAQCERLSLRGAAERIAHYVEAEGRDGRLELRQTRKSWAAELGLTHEALYRALASLQREGRMSMLDEDGVLVLRFGAGRGG
jgi:CRP/FNR family transcriptional regulator, dissimilatory nitrate respiration regulator